jgi:tetratricopeptide (TPR) repeat protein
MSDDADKDLIALIAREQRGFRTMLVIGIAVLALLAAMSAALGVYYYRVSEQMTRMVERQAFDTRRQIDQQTNRVANQDVRLRRIAEEVRRASRSNAAFTPDRMSDALAAARAYLERGQLSLDNEQLIEDAANSASVEGASRALLAGVARLIAFDRSGAGVQTGAEALPQSLTEAHDLFDQARADPASAPMASIGLAFVLNNEALRSGYREGDCEALFQAVAASAGAGGAPAPRPLFWRANCERKLGRTGDALRDYAAMLSQTAPAAQSPEAGVADVDLAMNAFHGVGTTLIALHGTSPDDDNMRAGLNAAQRACPPVEGASGSQEMQLAIACLRQAIALRRRLGQNANQQSGTGENLGFAYLRDNDFQGAFDHAQNVERTGLFAWNELVRALSAAHVGAAAADAGREARRNISFFEVRQFNLCEVRVLLNPDLYAEAVRIIQREHRNEPVACDAGSA